MDDEGGAAAWWWAWWFAAVVRPNDGCLVGDGLSGGSPRSAVLGDAAMERCSAGCTRERALSSLCSAFKRFTRLGQKSLPPPAHTQRRRPGGVASLASPDTKSATPINSCSTAEACQATPPRQFWFAGKTRGGREGPVQWNRGTSRSAERKQLRSLARSLHSSFNPNTFCTSCAGSDQSQT